MQTQVRSRPLTLMLRVAAEVFQQRLALAAIVAESNFQKEATKELISVPALREKVVSHPGVPTGRQREVSEKERLMSSVAQPQRHASEPFGAKLSLKFSGELSPTVVRQIVEVECQVSIGGEMKHTVHDASFEFSKSLRR